MTRRVAVTGIGIVAPGGIGVPAFWDLLAAGRTATRGITFFDPSGLRSRIAAECDFDPAASGLDAEQTARCDRYIQFALAAGAEAVRDAGLDVERENPWRIGVSLGTAVGGTTRLEHDYVLVSHHGRRWDVDPRQAEPYLHRAFAPSTLAATVAERFGARGPVQTVSTGCTSGLDAVGYAFHTVEEGRADICIAGASDSPISPITMACFDAIKATSPTNDDPAHASRPFDADRNGFVMGEGGAVLVLEELEHAKARGAKIYAEVAGYGLSSDANHITEPDPTGPVRAFHMALGDAGVDVGEIDYINAHATSTPIGDASETKMLKLALGEENARKTPVSGTKGATGHCLGAAGAIEAAFTVLAVQDDVLPPTINYEVADPECDLDYVPNEPRQATVQTAVSNSFGFGGHNACVVFRKF